VGAHARLSPSSAYRWLVCPGSVALAEAAPRRTSAAATQGTACHTLLDSRLRWGNDAAHPFRWPPDVGVEADDGSTTVVTITEERRAWVEQVAVWVEEYLDTRPGSSLYTETRAEVGAVFGCPEDLWGTADVVVSTPSTRELLVADAKFGFNPVRAEENTQLLLYAIGLARLRGYAHDTVHLVILQPRAYPPVQEWTISGLELERWRDNLRPKVWDAMQANGPLVPGEEQCKWCPAAWVCPALQGQALAIAQADFAPLPKQALKQAPTGKLVELLKLAPMVRVALDAAETEAFLRLQAGQEVPGWKLVYGEKRRVWGDPVAAKGKLHALGFTDADILKVELVTPPQAEKLVGEAKAEALSPLIVKPRGEPTLAREDDKREPVKSEFQRLDAQDLLE
jgi:hypothetical protein